MKPTLKAQGTLKDVARLVGVSTATVSNAFSRPDQLSAQLRKKILAAARSLNYAGPNPAARMLSTGFARTLAVVYGQPLPHAFYDPAASAFVGGVAEACAQQRLGLLLLQGGGAFQDIVRAAAFDGLIIYGMPKGDVTIQAALDRAVPTIVVDQPLLPKVPFIGIDDRAGARACARHLKDLGHQRVGIVTFALHEDGYCGPVGPKRLKKGCLEVGLRRLQGYLDVLGPSGPEGSVTIWECPRSNEEDGRAAAENLFGNEPRPTAILAMSDRLAIGVMEAARRHQLRIPQDLAVVGFDDIPAAKVIAPRLTTVRQTMEEKGRLAALSLRKENGPLRLKLPTKLIIRQSSDPTVQRPDQEREIDIR
jgi:DNA-binding LacI/PurR family transcriptional regulator